ncbi:unnamed protein product [Arctogadus glacialis]
MNSGYGLYFCPVTHKAKGGAYSRRGDTWTPNEVSACHMASHLPTDPSLNVQTPEDTTLRASHSHDIAKRHRKWCHRERSNI